jgi:tRNA dimethylallyltransferase
VLFVGGTPLYLKGLLRGVFEGPPADWELRRQLTDDAARHGDAWLHERLAAVDPVAAARLHPHDTRRLIRALEVFEKLGQPISELQRQFEVAHAAAECRVFVLDWPKAELGQRIDERVKQMFSAGLVAEVQRLLAASRPLGRTARQAVGYREVIEHIEGRHNLAETVELVRLHTRQLAKRQGTWFRSLSECRFVAVSGQIDVAATAQRIAAEGGRQGS